MKPAWHSRGLILLLIASSVPARALAQASASLSWVRLEGAEVCVSDARLIESVEARFGPIFDTATDADLHLEGWVQPGTREAFEARLRVTRGGRQLGTRALVGHAQDCSDLTRQLQVVIALLLDPDRSWQGQFPGIFDDAPPSPGATLLQDLPEAAPPTPEPLVPKPLPADEPGVDEALADAPQSEGERERRWAAVALFGPAYGGGSKAFYWMEGALQAHLGESWWLRGSFSSWYSHATEPLAVATFGGRMEVCRALYARAAHHLNACLGAGAAAVRLYTLGFDDLVPRADWAANAQLSTQVLFERNIARWGLVAASVGLQANLPRVAAVEVLPDSEIRTEFTQSAVGVWGAAGIGVRF